MSKLRLYSVSDRYINFLRSDEKLIHVFDNKEAIRKHTRKYLGVALSVNSKNYFIPFSSPKNKDYIYINGEKTIRNDSPIIIRITSLNKIDNNLELKGTLNLSCMIPVPNSELEPYNINEEKDNYYKIIVQKEYEYIRKNSDKIVDAAKLLYSQRKAFDKGRKCPRYISQVLDFSYAEKKMDEFILNNEKDSISASLDKVNQIADKIADAIDNGEIGKEQEQTLPEITK